LAFIVFEGGDGSGKSTQIKYLSGRLRRREHPFIVTREPGGTLVGEQLRRILKNRADISATGELLMFVAARNELVEQVIRPSINSGTTVICDRFSASTLAYQGYGQKLNMEIIKSLNDLATGDIKPDLTVFLDIPPETALSRISGRRPDKFDDYSLSFHNRVRTGFKEQAKANPETWLVLDASLPAQSLAINIWGKVKTLL
jgi:dTMP kinase